LSISDDITSVSKSSEGASDEGVSSEGASDEGVSSEGASDEGVSSEGASDEGVSSEGASDEGVSSEGASDDEEERFVGVKQSTVVTSDVAKKKKRKRKSSPAGFDEGANDVVALNPVDDRRGSFINYKKDYGNKGTLR
jgi:hypothetical protein